MLLVVRVAPISVTPLAPPVSVARGSSSSSIGRSYVSCVCRSPGVPRLWTVDIDYTKKRSPVEIVLESTGNSNVIVKSIH